MITQFAIRLICGMSLTWCVLPRSHVTSGYFRIQMLVTLGLSVLAAMSAGQLSATQTTILSAASVRWIAAGLAGLSFVGSVMWTLERRRSAAIYGFTIAGAAALTLVLSVASQFELTTVRGGLYCLSELATACVSGAAVSGMLLGHWYLTAPTMSTSPLNRANVWLGSTAGLRLVLAVAAVCLNWSVVSGKTTAAVGKPWTDTHSVWLALEWVGGIIGPIVVAVAVARILRYRNTQSATGVLFVGVILAFIGEMAAALLRNEMQLPL